MTTGPGEQLHRNRFRALPWMVSGAPWWAAAVLGLLLGAVGLNLLIRPLSALGVLGWYVGVSCLASGVADLITRRSSAPDGSRTGQPRHAVPDSVVSWGWIVFGVLILAWWGRDIDALGPAVAVALIVSGGVAALRLVLGRSWDLVPGLLFGVAEIVFGVLALLWPNATLIVIAVLFGGRTALFGMTLVLRAVGQVLHRTSRPAAPPRHRTRWLVVRWTGAVCVLALAVSTAWVSHTLRAGIPVVDAFYDTPEHLPDTPGALLKTGPYDGNLPPGLVGYRIYYTTTDAEGNIVPSSGMLAVPEDASGPVPLITWAHGTVGVARACAPSNGPDALIIDGEPAADQLAELGWAMVSTDYPGMGADGEFPYLIGEGEGRAVLDAARAARQVPGVTLSGQTVIWGHSQGGHGALWAGQLAADYAPDLDIVGTAALSPASDPRALADSVLSHPDRPGASLAIAFVVDAYTRYYPDISLQDTVVPSARIIVQEAAARCTGAGGTLVTILAGLAIARDQAIVRPGALDGVFGDRLRENIPTGGWAAPLFVGQGEADEVIVYRINAAYVEQLCSDGVDVEFRGYPGGTHMSVLATGSQLSADVVAWTKDRLAGRASVPNCR